MSFGYTVATALIFGVLFAFADPERNVFAWAFDHDGDFDGAAAGYCADPDRRRLKVAERYVSAAETRGVDRVEIPA